MRSNGACPLEAAVSRRREACALGRSPHGARGRPQGRCEASSGASSAAGARRPPFLRSKLNLRVAPAGTLQSQSKCPQWSRVGGSSGRREKRGRDGGLTDRTCDSRRGPLGARPRPPGFPRPHAAAAVHVTPAKRSRLQLPLTPPGFGLEVQSRGAGAGPESSSRAAPTPSRPGGRPRRTPRVTSPRAPRARAPRARPSRAPRPFCAGHRGAARWEQAVRAPPQPRRRPRPARPPPAHAPPPPPARRSTRERLLLHRVPRTAGARAHSD